MNIALRQKLILALLIMSIQPTFAAQDKTKLDAALEKVTNYLAQKKPDWKHGAVEPIQGSRNVSVNNWALEGRIVRVSIMGYRSDDEAIAAMRRFAAEERTLDRLPDLCDGGYSWGMGGSNIAFRKGDVTIWVSNSVTNLRQGVALTKEFATLIAEALCPN
jgi:hypothetical protein